MKDTIHYQVGQKIGLFTISSYIKDEARFILTCECGRTSKGATDHITKKISALLSDGFSGCQSCNIRFKNEVRKKRNENNKIYTYRDVYREYVKKSKARKIEFNLSLEDCYLLFKSNCTYCGVEPSNCRVRHTGAKVFYQGIDRVDNSKGYIKGNVCSCCKYCNFAKHDKTEEDFYKHIETIYLRRVQRLSSKEEYSQVAGNGKHPIDIIKGEDIV